MPEGNRGISYSRHTLLCTRPHTERAWCLQTLQQCSTVIGAWCMQADFLRSMAGAVCDTDNLSIVTDADCGCRLIF